MWHDNETDKDLLGFSVHAELIKNIVTDKDILPISIGLFGDWGSGKSSVMKMLENTLQEEKKVVVITFNGWVFEGYDDAKSALIETILKSIIKEEKILPAGIDAAKNLLKKVDWLRLGKLAVTNVGIPIAKAYATGGLSLIGDGLSKIADLFENPTELAKKLKGEDGKKLQSELKGIIKTNTENINQTPQVVREFRKEFEETIEKCKIDSLVILVDDLDRCTPDRIIDNLEAIKLFLNVKKTAFIIGADRRIVRHAIQHRYKANDLRDSEIGDYESLVTDYLEKLIQVPYVLPKLSETEVETFLTLLFCQRDLKNDFDKIITEFIAFRRKDRHSTFGFQQIQAAIGNRNELTNLAIIPILSPLITDGLKGNPRQIKRFLNAFTIRQKLANAANMEDFKNDVLIKLMILEYMDNDRFQELFKLQASESGFPELLKSIETDIEDIDNSIKEFPNWDKQSIRTWLKMEPLLSSIDLRDYFWLSRDKLSVSLQTANLVPPMVKKVYKELIESRTSTTITSRVKKIEELLESSDYIEHLINLTCVGILKDPKNVNGHNIMQAFMNERRQFISEYSSVIKNIPDLNQLPPSIGNNVFILESNGIDVENILKTLSSDPKCRAYKAYKTKKHL
ncbi:P-loop NTPase fold protein [uncultured Draconibacterium sp.]|uniref:KAP family P-loop NTPase fold protein n=1 Tax=uncultured Draconibacterium sp. TaxID=1573823 RepID=UPI0029C983FC|nr:P-loop NTPase fold protein [uncultured Draconibacterium sp.]